MAGEALPARIGGRVGESILGTREAAMVGVLEAYPRSPD